MQEIWEHVYDRINVPKIVVPKDTSFCYCVYISRKKLNIKYVFIILIILINFISKNIFIF